MNEKKTLIAIRKVLAQWNLSCAEESCLKKQLADELMLAVKNCNAPAVSKSLPIGDVEILLKGLEHIGKWGDEEEERWDDPGDCAMDTLTQYRYSMSIR